MGSSGRGSLVRRSGWVYGVVIGGAALSWTEPASAFCRTTTCNGQDIPCVFDEAGCATTGTPVYWPDLCVSFAFHADGSTLRGISAEKAGDALRKAFQTWISADCGDGKHPSLGAFSNGEVYCTEAEYNYDAVDKEGEKHVAGPNANLMVFRDDAWTYVSETQTLAVTTITFAKQTGQILDADIELNSFETIFTTGEEVVHTDLQAVLTHEVGHFLGLAHSRAPGATMNADYDSGNLDFRSLTEDDRQAICAVYPPLEDDVASEFESPDGSGIDCRGSEPRFGFSRYCGEPVLADGCAVASRASAASSLGGPVVLGLAALALVLRLRRRHGQAQRTPLLRGANRSN
jgi:uncharacterized protein (TIGR03382 family)